MLRLTFASLLTALFLTGCLHTLPKTSDLKEVHETYRDEFAQVALASPLGDDGAQGSDDFSTLSTEIQNGQKNPYSFDKTLRAIRKFRVKYEGRQSELAKELAHLDVLEGMIYLQSGHFGSAAAVEQQVAAAGEILTSDDELVVRDRLFALAFDHLITGWREINRGVAEKSVNRSNLEGAAEGIAALLTEVVPEDNDAPEVDDAGIYLATTAAIYWVWLHELYSRDCEFTRAPCNLNAANEEERKKAEAIKASVKDKSYYKKACALITRYLAPTERAAASVSRTAFPARSSGRLRFLRWYAWFHEQGACKQAAVLQ